MGKYIDKEWLINALVEVNSESDMPTEWHKGFNEAIDYVKHTPTTESRPKGKWIKDRYCSSCEWDKNDFDYIVGWKENFCPCCGVSMVEDMRGEGE